MKCPKCGANMEVTKFDDGTILIRRDCNCDMTKEELLHACKKET